MSIPQQITKTHATGNDFVVYADPDGAYEPTPDEVRFLCDRHFGVGADGLIRLAHPADVSDLTPEQVLACEDGGAAWFMDYRNADGSLAEMCGNGTRAVTLFAQSLGLAPKPDEGAFRLGTRAGVKTLTPLGAVEGLGRDVFRVEIGAWRIGEIGEYEVTIPGTAGSARGTFVDMGNPHVVAVLQDGIATLPAVEDLDLAVKPQVLPVIESDQNVEFVRVDGTDEETGEGRATMRVNERGCGETLSCGTGLCATGVTLRALTGIGHWTIRVRGGVLRVDVTDRDVTLTGAATIVGRVTLEPRG
ncbi:diaminopimelate epimerase [Bifidobacterium sp. DSM 109958]|uniref:Diaminopimelate epimerase n=1 Tax=Bifidobacterium moraviense TaxID=2675323 RepID=A0A7Y0HZ77_9BIFI|nr:diaminopimelate epimerase [Bifidobacterium sp. DSM 109958]NMN00143.1 diaminopimelate epimerase [Bifidobacterium sp. DSM 109958]